MTSQNSRLKRIEDQMHEDLSLNVEDIELMLSCLPPEYADAVRRRLIEIVEERRASGEYYEPVISHGKTKNRRGLNRAKLEFMLDSMPSPESRAILKKKLGI